MDERIAERIATARLESVRNVDCTSIVGSQQCVTLEAVVLGRNLAGENIRHHGPPVSVWVHWGIRPKQVQPQPGVTGSPMEDIFVELGQEFSVVPEFRVRSDGRNQLPEQLAPRSNFSEHRVGSSNEV